MRENRQQEKQTRMIVNADQSHYIGEVTNGIANGKGIYYYPDHSDDLPHYFRGQFSNGKAYGQGTLVHKFYNNSSSVYETVTCHCHWENDLLNEGKEGTMETKENDVKVGQYTGTFQYDIMTGKIQPHGQGEYKYFNVSDHGSVYKGDYKNGKQHGTGNLIYSENIVFEYYTGEFKGGMGEGSGALKFKHGYKNGVTLKGKFKNNNSDGLLTAYETDNNGGETAVYKCTFEWPEDERAVLHKYSLAGEPEGNSETFNPYAKASLSNDDYFPGQKQVSARQIPLPFLLFNESPSESLSIDQEAEEKGYKKTRKRTHDRDIEETTQTTSKRPHALASSSSRSQIISQQYASPEFTLINDGSMERDTVPDLNLGSIDPNAHRLAQLSPFRDHFFFTSGRECIIK